MNGDASMRTVLEAIAEFTNGGAWGQGEYSENGVPVVRVTDIENETVDLSDCKFLPRSLLSKYDKHSLRAGDLVICTVGSHPTQPGSVVGRAAVIPEFAHGALLNQNAVCIRSSSPDVDQSWLGYFGRTRKFRNYIISCARGSANQVRMAIGLLKKMPVEVPPLPVQRRVAGILMAYDALIENNSRRVAILEEMARRIFEEWFVHFRAPGCEGMPVVDSSLGLIPKGWEVKRLDALIDFDPNGSVPNGIKPFVPMTALSTTSMIVGEIERRDTRSGSKFGQGDTLLARITPCLENGKTGFVDFLNQGETGVGSTEFVVMRGQSVPPTFVQLLARSQAFRAHAIKSMSGATGRQRVRRESLEQFKIATPPQAVAQCFNANVSPLFKLARILADQNANLRAQRDLLLPKLISGEIDVSAAPLQQEAAE
jgi:type I restriction enzyme, S subunit